MRPEPRPLTGRNWQVAATRRDRGIWSVFPSWHFSLVCPGCFTVWPLCKPSTAYIVPNCCDAICLTASQHLLAFIVDIQGVLCFNDRKSRGSQTTFIVRCTRNDRLLASLQERLSRESYVVGCDQKGAT